MFNPLNIIQSMCNPNNPVFGQMFGGYQNFQNEFSNFANNFQSQAGGADPQQIVNGLMDHGKMSQEEFNRYRQIANMMTGKNM